MYIFQGDCPSDSYVSRPAVTLRCKICLSFSIAKRETRTDFKSPRERQEDGCRKPTRRTVLHATQDGALLENGPFLRVKSLSWTANRESESNRAQAQGLHLTRTARYLKIASFLRLKSPSRTTKREGKDRCRKPTWRRHRGST